MRVIENCDSREYIKTIDDDSIDLVILDPDYDLWESMINDGLITESMRILKDSGNLLCFTKQPFDYELRKAINQYFRREIVWTFTNGGAWISNQMPLVSFQKIYWCIKSKEFYFNPRTGIDYNDSTKDFKRSRKVFGGWDMDGKQFQRSGDGIWLRDHLHFNKPQSGEIPAKPKELIRILVKCFCPDGGIVYDAFSGSGTVIKVADEFGCSVIGNEIDKQRCRDIQDQFRQMSINDWLNGGGNGKA